MISSQHRWLADRVADAIDGQAAANRALASIAIDPDALHAGLIALLDQPEAVRAFLRTIQKQIENTKNEGHAEGAAPKGKHDDDSLPQSKEAQR